MKKGYYGDLVSPEVRRELERQGIIIPVGAVEQHGPHLPLTVDLDIAEAIATELGNRLGAYVARGIPYSARSLPQSGGGYPFPGTVSVRGTCLIEYFQDIFTDFANHGARFLFVVNGHYENEPFIFEAMEVCREAGVLDGVEVIALSWWSVVGDEFIQTAFGGTFPGWHAEHGGLCETSLMLFLRPELVRQARPKHAHPPIAGVYLHPIDPSQISDRGVLAITSGASADIGAALFEHICTGMVKFFRSPHGLARP